PACCLCVCVRTRGARLGGRPAGEPGWSHACREKAACLDLLGRTDKAMNLSYAGQHPFGRSRRGVADRLIAGFANILGHWAVARAIRWICRDLWHRFVAPGRAGGSHTEVRPPPDPDDGPTGSIPRFN